MLAVRASCIIQFRGAFVERWYDLLIRPVIAAARAHPPMQHNSALVALAAGCRVGDQNDSTIVATEL
jgi:hypothetical protein